MIKISKLIHDYIQRDEEGNPSGTIRAINDISLDVEQGQFIAILGHNGSGKSTLAKHLNALLFPTEGAVWVNGLDTKDQSLLWEIRQTAGMVFQNPDNQLVATIVEEDVAFGPENIGVPSKEIRKRVDDALEIVGMSAFAKHSPHQLSGGQKQRVAIAGIIALRPEIIIFDESTAMLDPRGRNDVLATIEKLNRDFGTTILHITHYMEEAIRADRVIVIDEGRVHLDGTPREVFSSVDTLKKIGLDVPQVTELMLALDRDGIKIAKDTLTVSESADAIEAYMKKQSLEKK